MDCTTKISGERPPTKLLLSVMSLPRGASTGKKNYIATFIGGSTIAGWPIPCHIQTRSTVALTENQKISLNRFRNTQNFRGIYVGANPKAAMNADELHVCPDAMDVPLTALRVLAYMGGPLFHLIFAINPYSVNSRGI